MRWAIPRGVTVVERGEDRNAGMQPGQHVDNGHAGLRGL
jgi:hypothetical protein